MDCSWKKPKGTKLKYIRTSVSNRPIVSVISLYYHRVQGSSHGPRTPGEEIAFTTRLKIHSHYHIFRYGRIIFCLPHWPKFSDFFDLCLHWVSVVLGSSHTVLLSQKGCVFGKSVEKGTNKGTHLYYETAADSTTTTLAPKMHFGFVF